jgi:hypothetical protein
MSPFSGFVDLLEAMGVVRASTTPGKKQGWLVSDIDGEEFFFRPAEMTMEVAKKLLTHPACKPIAARNATPDEDATAEDLDAVTDQDEQPQPLTLKKRGKKE